MANNDPKGDAALSFEEIGRELGITAGGAGALYASAMRKLRSRRRTPAVQTLKELAESKRSLR